MHLKSLQLKSLHPKIKNLKEDLEEDLKNSLKKYITYIIYEKNNKKKSKKDDIRVLHIPLDHLIASEKIMKMLIEYELEKNMN